MRANQVRIVGGQWRSRHIRFVPAAGVRPTADRVRETLFNWLGQDLTGLVCLDLFAGSGALGFEAASRGATRVVMVESNRSVFEGLRSNKTALEAARVELARADALEFVRRDRSQYDIIFLDPPFAAGYWPQLMPLLPPRLAPRGSLYCETSQPVEWPGGWRVHREGRAGQVKFQLLRRDDHEPHRGLPGDVRPDHTGP